MLESDQFEAHGAMPNGSHSPVSNGHERADPTKTAEELVTGVQELLDRVRLQNEELMTFRGNDSPRTDTNRFFFQFLTKIVDHTIKHFKGIN